MRGVEVANDAPLIERANPRQGQVHPCYNVFCDGRAQLEDYFEMAEYGRPYMRLVDEFRRRALLRLRTNGKRVQKLLADNNLKGELPPELGFLTRLRQSVLLNGNALQDTIHEDIWMSGADISRLELLTNNLTGSLPAILGLFTNLFCLDAQNILFASQFPTELGL